MINKKILGVIPARGGSKGIPKKNLHLLNNKPLIQYSIDAAKQSELINDFIVSTDCLEIKKISEDLGAIVPFIRPKYLSNDNALAIPTIQHAVSEYEKIMDTSYDYIIMLQPTAPLRTEHDIDEALTKLIKNNADGIISIVDVDNFHPQKMKIINQNKLFDYLESSKENPPRQSLPKTYIVNGAIYATKRDILMNQNTFKGKFCLPYVMPDNRSTNIDKDTDFIVAEYYLNNL